MGLIQYNTQFFKTDHDMVLELHTQKNTNKEISDKLNITLYMVEKILSYYELTPVKNIDKINHQIVIDLYNEHRKISEVANILEIEEYMVDKILIHNNITKRSVTLKLDSAEIIRDYLECRDVNVVAEKYNVSVTPIIKILKDNGIQRKKNPNVYKRVVKNGHRIKIEIDVNYVIELYKELGTIAAVSRELNVKDNKVRTILLSNNVELNVTLKYIEVGDVFDMLTIVGLSDNKRTSGGESKKMLLCKCECGNEVIRSSSYFRNKKNGKLTYKSCGCHVEDKKKKNEELRIKKKLEYEQKLKEWEITRIKKERKKIEYKQKHGDKKYNIGDKKDRFTITGIEGKHPNKMMSVICECGTDKVLRYMAFKSAKSCGCLQKERSYRNGLFTNNDKEKELMYARYKNMKRRCYNEKSDNYYLYGGRGIIVCDRWLESNGQGFVNFCMDMGERPGSEYSIDRINPDGNYEPSNCRWATPSVQAKNQRRWKTN